MATLILSCVNLNRGEWLLELVGHKDEPTFRRLISYDHVSRLRNALHAAYLTEGYDYIPNLFHLAARFESSRRGVESNIRWAWIFRTLGHLRNSAKEDEAAQEFLRDMAEQCAEFLDVRDKRAWGLAHPMRAKRGRSPAARWSPVARAIQEHMEVFGPLFVPVFTRASRIVPQGTVKLREHLELNADKLFNSFIAGIFYMVFHSLGAPINPKLDDPAIDWSATEDVTSKEGRSLTKLYKMELDFRERLLVQIVNDFSNIKGEIDQNTLIALKLDPADSESVKTIISHALRAMYPGSAVDSIMRSFKAPPYSRP